MTVDIVLSDLRLTIPSLPPAEFSPNSRVPWPKRYQAGLIAKDEVIALILEQGWQGPALAGSTVRITWGLPTKGEIDWDNLVARTKPYVDGLVDAGVLVGDSVRDYQPEYRWFDSPKNPQTIIEVEVKERR